MLEILDTTLRDGEQTAGVSFNPDEKLAIARLLLEEMGVDRVEVASVGVSRGERESCAKICSWASEAGLLQRIEILGFIDGGKSARWIHDVGGKVYNLLMKGSLRQLEGQLRKTPGEHLRDVRECIDIATSLGLEVNVYLEDWSTGMQTSPEYVEEVLRCLSDTPVRRFMLPDTLGILSPSQVREYVGHILSTFPRLRFDFHAHNDYDLASANVLEALREGVHGIHTTVNGLGERAGNVPLSSVLGILNDILHIPNSLHEKNLTHVSRYVESISGVRIPPNKPLVGESVFTQTSGVHADGDRKGGLYQNALKPERFGRVREYALGKMSGKANIMENLKQLGIRLTPEQMRSVTDRVVELGDKKESISPEDLPFIVADVLKEGFRMQERDKIEIINYSLQLARGMRPVAAVRIRIENEEYEETSAGDGQYDAVMKALWKIYSRLGKSHPVLTDYRVSIPPGGKTDALVETIISWNDNGHEFKTRGLDPDQTVAAIKATLKMLNLCENNYFHQSVQ